MRQALLLCTLLAASLGGQTRFEYWPGANYDPAIPAYPKVLGYETGERLTWHAGLVRYLEALAAAAPRRVKVFDYAKSWEGRRLVYGVVASESNLRRLEEIRAGMKALADPRRTPEAEAKKLIASLPAVIWIGAGVHGNELSSPEAALLAAYHLLAARNDKMVDEILSKVVVLIDPIQNPDGRDRFIHHFQQSEGPLPDPSPLAAEHNEPWPGGRTNHYYFDMNRDWFALTQPETRGRVKALQEWYPLVFVDLHEMGSDSTYFFAPGAAPYNPHLTKDQITGLEWFGKNNARWFDKFGFSYFTREVFDEFYPGYGASWPAYHGCIAMTYEQASSRGLLMRRTDGQVFHFRDTIRQHFVSTLATAETAARNREQLLANFYRYRQTAIEEGGKEPVREYILVRQGDTAAADKLAANLAAQGIEVKRAKAAFRTGGRDYPAGSYVISLAQPAKRLIRVLLDPHVDMDDVFIKEQERRRQKKLPDEIYDVTAWSLPLLYGVEAVASAEATQAPLEAVAADAALPGSVEGGKAMVAYLVPWGTAAASKFLLQALQQDLRLWSSDKAFTLNGVKYPRGTLILKVQENPASLHETVQKIAVATGAEVRATATSWVEEGVNFGSRHVLPMRKANVALAWDRPVSGGSAGHTRFVLERQYEYPVTAIRCSTLATADLRRFDVLILPEGGFGEGYSAVLGTNGIRRLKDWVSGGGTLIGYGSALAFLADSRVGLLAISQESLAKPGETAKKPEPSPRPETSAPATSAAQQPARTPGKIFQSEEDYLKAIRADSELPDAVAGVLLRAKVDPDHWITAGAPDTVNALVQGRAIFTPIKLDKGVNAALFLGPDKLLASGYIWRENRDQLAYKPLLVVQGEGRGLVIGFTADPNYRAYMDGLNILFLNAVFRGAAHARPAASGVLE